MIHLDGRVALVTGAGGAIGSAITRTLVANGGRVAAHDIDRRSLDLLREEFGEDVATIIGDLSDLPSVDRVWAEAVSAFGRVDVLVNNAGVYLPASIKLPVEEWLAVWRRSLAINLEAPGVLCRAAVHAFTDQGGGGTIINLASRAAFRGDDPDYWHYAAAKAGIVAMTRTIARHYGRAGITAFAIAPGYVDTPFNQAFADEVGVSVAAADTALGGVARAEDVANVVAFLASGLARHMTGATLDINSGSYMR